MSQTVTLGKNARKLLKLVHLLSISVAIGGVVVLFILIGIKNTIAPTSSPFLIDYAIYKIFNDGINISFFVVIGTGLIYSIFTNWGFVRHYWVLCKWVVVLIIFGLTWGWLGPAINGTASIADSGLSITDLGGEYLLYTSSSLLYLLIQTFLLLLILLVSVWKPWGPIKSRFNISQKKTILIAAVILIPLIGYMVYADKMLDRYRNMEIEDTVLSGLNDNVYRGEYLCGSFTYKVDVIVKNEMMTGINVRANRDSTYARFSEGVINKILLKQNANVDAIVGATTTSKCLMKTVEKAFQKE